MNGTILALLITALLLGILLMLRLGARAAYRDGVLTVWLCVGILSFIIYPRRNKPGKTRRKKEKKLKKSPGKDEKPKVKKPLGELLSALGELGGVSRRLLRRIRVERIEGVITAGGKGAADVAISYGMYCTAIGTLRALLDNTVTLKTFRLEADYDFKSDSIRAHGVIYLTFRLIYILAAACGFVRVIIKRRRAFIGEKVPEPNAVVQS